MTETTDDNVIKLVFNAEKREEDKVDLTAISILEDTIQSYMKDPPSTDFQLGYLFCAVDLLSDLGGPDYAELAHHYMERMLK